MSALPAALGAVPQLAFEVSGAHAQRYAASPAIALTLRVARSDGVAVRSLMLSAQVRIAAPARRHGERERERLRRLFGDPGEWGRTVRSLLWANVTVLVPPFDGATEVELALPCSCDMDVAAAGYLDALDGGSVPIELLFAGTVFEADPQGRLRVWLIPASAEARFAMPVALWREAIDRHFPDSSWLRLRRDVFERLARHRDAGAFLAWEGALEALLDGREAS